MQSRFERWNDSWDRPTVRRIGWAALAVVLLTFVVLASHRAMRGSSEFPGFRLLSRTMLLPPGDPGRVTVRDGRLVLEAGDPWTAVASSGEEFPGRYELEFEVMAVEEDRELCTVVFPVGAKRWVLKVGARGGSKVGLTGLDGLGIQLNGTVVWMDLAPNDWHRVRLDVGARRVLAHIDDTKAVDVARLGRSYALWPSYEAVRPFGILTHNAESHLRNIRVRGPGSDTEESELRASGQWRKLFDGTAMSGLRRVTEFSDRGDIYDVIGHKRAYPPFFTLAFFPFSWMWPAVGAVLFALVSTAAVLLCTRWCLRASWPTPFSAPGAEGPRFGVGALICMLMLPLMIGVIVRCETDMIILLCLCGGLYLLTKGGRPFWAGAVFSIAAAIKLTPAFLGVYLLWRRNWKALAGMVVGGVVLVGIVPSLIFGVDGNLWRHQRWWREVMVPYREAGAKGVIRNPYRSTNQSITAASCRFLTDSDALAGKGEWRVNVADWPEARARMVGKIAALAMLVTALALWWGKGSKDPPLLRVMQFGLALIVMLELSEVSLTTHHVALIVPFTAMLTFLSEYRYPSTERHVVCCGLFCSCALLALCAKSSLKCLSPTTFAALVQFVVVAWLTMRYRLGRWGAFKP